MVERKRFLLGMRRGVGALWQDEGQGKAMNSFGRMVGKRALVTGAGNGIGRAIAEAFAQEGSAVCIADIDGEAADSAARGIAARGGKVLAVQCDVSDRASTRRAVDRAAAEMDGLNVLVCNAAVLSPKTRIHEMTEENWNTCLAVNLTGAFLVCKYGIPYLQKSGGGSVILVGSQMARVANPLQVAYCTTKAALVHLAKGIALEYAVDNIRANALSPGGTATSRMERQFGTIEKAQEVWGRQHPLGRLGTPEEIAHGAVFLASEESAFMTGADLLMDGGYAAR